MRKAQVQAISLVLITGIVISLAGAAYFWGKPLIEKRTTITDISTAELFIIQLDKEIVDVARNRGEKIINIPALSGASLNLTAGENAVFFNFFVSQSMLKLGKQTAPVPIESVHIEPDGTYGESPRVITLESWPYQTQFFVSLKLKYRTLTMESEPKRGYKIELRSAGKDRGGSKVKVSHGGIKTETVAGVEILRTFIDVAVT